MALSQFNYLKDDTRIVKYQDNAYKIKVIYQNCNRKDFQTLTPSKSHKELEQVFRAVLYADQRNQKLPEIKTNHFMVSVQKKIWKSSEKVFFRKDDSDIKCHAYMFVFTVQANDELHTDGDQENELTIRSGRRLKSLKNVQDDHSDSDMESELKKEVRHDGKTRERSGRSIRRKSDINKDTTTRECKVVLKRIDSHLLNSSVAIKNNKEGKGSQKLRKKEEKTNLRKRSEKYKTFSYKESISDDDDDGDIESKSDSDSYFPYDDKTKLDKKQKKVKPSKKRSGKPYKNKNVLSDISSDSDSDLSDDDVEMSDGSFKPPAESAAEGKQIKSKTKKRKHPRISSTEKDRQKSNILKPNPFENPYMASDISSDSDSDLSENNVEMSDGSFKPAESAEHKMRRKHRIKKRKSPRKSSPGKDGQNFSYKESDEDSEGSTGNSSSDMEYEDLDNKQSSKSDKKNKESLRSRQIKNKLESSKKVVSERDIRKEASRKQKGIVLKKKRVTNTKDTESTDEEVDENISSDAQFDENTDTNSDEHSDEDYNVKENRKQNHKDGKKRELHKEYVKGKTGKFPKRRNVPVKGKNWSRARPPRRHLKSYEDSDTSGDESDSDSAIKDIQKRKKQSVEKKKTAIEDIESDVNSVEEISSDENSDSKTDDYMPSDDNTDEYEPSDDNADEYIPSGGKNNRNKARTLKGNQQEADMDDEDFVENKEEKGRKVLISKNDKQENAPGKARGGNRKKKVPTDENMNVDNILGSAHSKRNKGMHKAQETSNRLGRSRKLFTASTVPLERLPSTTEIGMLKEQETSNRLQRSRKLFTASTVPLEHLPSTTEIGKDDSLPNLKSPISRGKSPKLGGKSPRSQEGQVSKTIDDVDSDMDESVRATRFSPRQSRSVGQNEPTETDRLDKMKIRSPRSEGPRHVHLQGKDRYLIQQEELEETMKLQQLSKSDPPPRRVSPRKRKSSGVWDVVDTIITPIKRLMSK